jgi:FkbM family methyltransferase
MIVNENNLGKYNVPDDVNGICIDIGSNVGNFLKKYGSRFKLIYAYEPIKLLYDKIKNYNIDNVIIYNEAVSDIRGETEIILHKNNESGSSAIKRTIDDVIKTNHWSENIINKVNMVTLDDIIERTGSNEIDYLKIDCENSEYHILINKDLSKIKYIGIELHGHMGEYNWNTLKNWVNNTHSGFPSYNGNNKEILLTRKNKL